MISRSTTSPPPSVSAMGLKDFTTTHWQTRAALVWMDLESNEGEGIMYLSLPSVKRLAGFLQAVIEKEEKEKDDDTTNNP